MTCADRGCTQEAAVAVTTRRPQRDNVMTTIYWDERAAKVPAKAERLCEKHLIALIRDLAPVLAP